MKGRTSRNSWHVWVEKNKTNKSVARQTGVLILYHRTAFAEEIAFAELYSKFDKLFDCCKSTRQKLSAQLACQTNQRSDTHRCVSVSRTWRRTLSRILVWLFKPVKESWRNTVISAESDICSRKRQPRWNFDPHLFQESPFAESYWTDLPQRFWTGWNNQHSRGALFALVEFTPLLESTKVTHTHTPRVCAQTDEKLTQSWEMFVFSQVVTVLTELLRDNFRNAKLKLAVVPTLGEILYYIASQVRCIPQEGVFLGQPSGRIVTLATSTNWWRF